MLVIFIHRSGETVLHILPNLSDSEYGHNGKSSRHFIQRSQTMHRYIVKTSSARMPQSCWGRYAHVAVIEMKDGPWLPPKMISSRAVGVSKVVARWERVHVGKTGRCAFRRALVEAGALADLRNLV